MTHESGSSGFVVPVHPMLDQELALSPPIGSVSDGRPNTAEEAKETHTQNEAFSLTHLSV